MMDIPKFSYMNLLPRGNSASQMNQELEIILDRAPSDASCTALMERVEDHFLIEIVVRSSQGIFRAFRSFDIRDLKGRDRLWHLPVVSEMSSELRRKFGHWHLKNAA